MSQFEEKNTSESEELMRTLNKVTGDDLAPVNGKADPANPKTMTRKERKAARYAKNPGLYEFLDWVKIIVIAVILALLINNFVIINSRVPSGSMENTIMTNSHMIGFRLSYLFSDPQRGDIIVFRYPDDPSVKYVKRIIGLPGETVEIKAGVVYIDGVKLEENYLKETPNAENFGPYVVPENSYFVLGDNRNNSKDSRYWTTTNYVSRKAILGKALLVYWPFTQFKILK